MNDQELLLGGVGIKLVLTVYGVDTRCFFSCPL